MRVRDGWTRIGYGSWFDEKGGDLYGPFQVRSALSILNDAVKAGRKDKTYLTHAELQRFLQEVSDPTLPRLTRFAKLYDSLSHEQLHSMLV